MDIYKESLRLHRQKNGKLETVSKVSLKTAHDLGLAYTPGVAAACRAIASDKKKVYDYTIKRNTIGVVSDGSAVLGLGNIGAEAALPVMEGKCVLFKEFAGVDAFPICLRTQKAHEIVEIVKNIAPAFGGINLEDISGPRCFEIEKKLQNIGIPVFHDDQHGTAIVVLAALFNSLKLVKKKFQDVRVVVSGAGAAGIAITKMLSCLELDNGVCTAVGDLVLVDSQGIIHKKRKGLTSVKKVIAATTNHYRRVGDLANAVKGADVFIGASAPNIMTKQMVKSMNKNAVVFAMANPVPEIMPADAMAGGAAIVGTGRSDFPNQVNNVLAFPGVFRGALDAGAVRITQQMNHAAAHALAKCVKGLSRSKVLPSPLDKNVAGHVAAAVKSTAIEQRVVR